jgi:hypothetical protein
MASYDVESNICPALARELAKLGIDVPKADAPPAAKSTKTFSVASASERSAADSARPRSAAAVGPYIRGFHYPLHSSI